MEEPMDRRTGEGEGDDRRILRFDIATAVVSDCPETVSTAVLSIFFSHDTRLTLFLTSRADVLSIAVFKPVHAFQSGYGLLVVMGTFLGRYELFEGEIAPTSPDMGIAPAE